MSHEYLSSSKSYIKLIHLNELVTGQSQEYLFNKLQKFDEEFNINFDKYYVCITGLKKKTYTGIYHTDAKMYMQIYVPLESHIQDYLNNCGYRNEIFLFCYFNTKQIILILSPDEDCHVSVEDVSEYITNLIQRIYEEKIFGNDNRYCNFTTITPLLSHYNQLASAFERIRKLNECSFFSMQPMVMNEKIFEKIKIAYSHSEAFELLDNLYSAISNGEIESALNMARELFIHKLKYSFDFELCWDVLSEIKRLAFRFSTIFDLNIENYIKMLDTGSHASIEELYDDVKNLVRYCAEVAKQKGNGMGYISQEAIRFIKKNYDQNITLSDVARNVNIVPGYLSAVFNNEVGTSILSYITNLRIKQSQNLLVNSNLKIFEIANKVGFQNPRYFSQIFKKHTGRTPLEYRDTEVQR